MLVKRRELAEALGVTSPTTYKWEDEGIIVRAIDEGGVVRFDLEECLERFKKRATVNTLKRKPKTLQVLAAKDKGASRG